MSISGITSRRLDEVPVERFKCLYPEYEELRRNAVSCGLVIVCKGRRSGIGLLNAERSASVENLRRHADVLPVNRFETYIVFAKLAPFTPEEITLVKSLNGPFQQRVILLTARQLEPYHLYERTKPASLGASRCWSTPKHCRPYAPAPINSSNPLCRATSPIYA
jgi:hypothetical protein